MSKGNLLIGCRLGPTKLRETVSLFFYWIWKKWTEEGSICQLGFTPKLYIICTCCQNEFSIKDWYALKSCCNIVDVGLNFSSNITTKALGSKPLARAVCWIKKYMAELLVPINIVQLFSFNFNAEIRNRYLLPCNHIYK